MPPRPTPISRHKHNVNRLSAVYIGPNPATATAYYASSSPLSYTSPPIHTDSIPDLPEPPSPGGSDTGSGLPSPPATNSTGSTDDPQTLEVPERPLSLASSSGSSTNTGGGTSFSPKDTAASGSGSSNMRKGSTVTTTRSLHRSSSSTSSMASMTSRPGRISEESPARSVSSADLDRDPQSARQGKSHVNNEEEGDDTARFDLRRSIAATTSEVLQRAKSLTQRNRVTLDKLASIPRARSPKSSASTSGSSRSPALSHTSLPEISTSKPSTSRLSSSSSRGHGMGTTATTTTRSTTSIPHTPLRDPDPFPESDPVYRSGSETEKESTSSFRGSRPPSSASYTRPTASTLARSNTRTPPPSTRKRVPSAPSSPLHALTAVNTSLNAAFGGGGTNDYELDTTTTSTTTTSSHNTSSSGSASGSSSSRRRKRVSLALTTPSRLGVDSIEPGDDDEPHHNGNQLGEFGERDRGSVRARSSLSFTEERRRLWDRDRDKDQEPERDSVTKSALAAVASSRRGTANGNGSPYLTDGGGGSTSSGRRRGALPAEFIRGRPGEAASDHSPSPVTSYRPSSIVFTSSNSSSASGNTVISSSTHSSSAFSQTSCSASGAGGSSRAGSSLGITPRTTTIRRESRQKWASEDYTSNSSSSPSFAIESRLTMTEGRRRATEGRRYGDPPHTADITTSRHLNSRSPEEPLMRMGEYRERKQSMRGGSAESALALTPGRKRSLVTEGFRAAGLSGGAGRAQIVKRFSLGEEGNVDIGGPAFRRDEERRAAANGWESDGDGEDGMRRARTGVRSRGGEGGGGHPRAATSMADYRYTDGEDDERRERGLRSTRSAYPMSPRRRGERDASLTREREALAREREALEAERAASSMSRYGALRSHVLRDQQSLDRFSTPFGNGRRNHSGSSPTTTSSGAVVTQRDQEHLRLLADSLNMFEGQVTRLGAGSGSSFGELLKNAQTIVVATEKLNNILRCGNTRAVEEQVNAEVDDPNGHGTEMAELWGRVGGEYRDGLRVSDDLIRGMTAFLLGISKTVKDLAAGGSGEVQHGRSVSLDDEGLGSGRKRATRSPDVFAGPIGPASSAGSGSGRRSVESRRSWEERENTRDEVPRRFSARTESVLAQARPPSSVGRDRDRVDGRFDTPPSADASSRGSGSTSSQPRRLYTPREQREMMTPLHGTGMRTIYSQEPLDQFEPSPSPAPRNPSQTQSPALAALPRPLPALPSESFLRRNQSLTDRSATSTPPGTIRDRDRDRRKASANSIQTIRGNTSNPPASLTTPSNVTTAITAHTVSTMLPDDRMEFPAPQRTVSNHSTRLETVTFSRPSTVSVNALNGLQQKDERRRTGSNGSSGAEPSTSIPSRRITSGSEIERDTRRKTIGARAGRASMDGEASPNIVGARLSSTVNAADRSAALSARVAGGPPMNTARRERRRTVTDIWPNDS